MRPRVVVLCVAICAAVTGCGAGHTSVSHSISASTTTTAASTPAMPTVPPAGILGRVLITNELKGFTGSPSGIDTGIRSYLAEEESGVSSTQMNADYARLKRLGFMRGVVENLAMGATPGVSWVEEFPSPQAAGAELAAEIAEDKKGPSAADYAAFAVPGIPGARGISFLSGGQGGINIAFVKGPYYYLVGQELGPSESAHAGIANLIAAAQHLYRRVSS
jgi:hypothetical protein